MDKRVYRSCLMFFAFLPSELGCLSVIIGEAENGFAKMTKAFRRVEKWFCEIDKGISTGRKMRLRNSQRHFGGWKNGFAKLTKAFRRVEKWFCEIDKGISTGGKMVLRK